MEINAIHAYAAGLIDGEGCITIATFKRKNGTISYRLCLTVRMTHPAGVNFLKLHFGGTICNPKKKTTGNRQLFHWNAFSRLARTVLTDISPYLLVKKEEAICALQFADLSYFTPSPRKGQRGFQRRPILIGEQQHAFFLRIRELKKPRVYSYV